MSILHQLELLMKLHGKRDYTIQEIKDWLAEDFSSNRSFGNTMKKLGYTSHIKRTGTAVQRVYTLDTIHPIEPEKIPETEGHTERIVLKQLYLLAKTLGSKELPNGDKSIKEIRNWLTVKFKTNREFGNFMKKLGYTSYKDGKGRRWYTIDSAIVYPVSRTNRTANPSKSKLYVVEEKLYSVPWDGVGTIERKVPIKSNVTL